METIKDENEPNINKSSTKRIKTKYIRKNNLKPLVIFKSDCSSELGLKL